MTAMCGDRAVIRTAPALQGGTGGVGDTLRSLDPRSRPSGLPAHKVVPAGRFRAGRCLQRTWDREGARRLPRPRDVGPVGGRKDSTCRACV